MTRYDEGCRWPRLPDSPALPHDQVHIWRFSIESLDEHSDSFARTLSDDERTRAKHYHFLRDRTKFLVRRGMLRVILGRYLSVEPNRIQFDHGTYGKPRLASKFDSDRLEFNLAHSHNLAVYAFTRKRRIGIDLEKIQPLPNLEQISSQFFTSQESEKIQRLDGNARLLAFYHCWTRKEAYVKAIGNGLTHPLDQFQVSVEPTQPARLVRVKGQSQETARWSFKSFVPASGYVSALAVEGFDWESVFVNAP